MNNIIKVKPDSKGNYYITLYGTKYQLIFEKTTKTSKKEDNGE